MREELRAEGLELGDSETQIIPVMVGDANRTMDFCEETIERGVFAQGIRPPTVPNGSSRLRLAVMSTHRASELQRAARQIGEAAREVGVGLAPAIPESEWPVAPLEMPEAA